MADNRASRRAQAQAATLIQALKMPIIVFEGEDPKPSAATAEVANVVEIATIQHRITALEIELNLQRELLQAWQSGAISHV